MEKDESKLTEEEDLEDEDLEETVEEKSKVETKKTQSKEENHYYAELRRKNEELQKKNKDLEVKANEADFNARAKVISKDTLNELGIDSIEDEEDLILCEEYEKAIKKGLDNPVLEAQKAYRNKIKADKAKTLQEEEEKQKAIKTQNEQVKKVEEDKIKFKEKFGITTKEALKNEDFMKIYGKFIDYGNLTELYGTYLSIIGDSKDKEEAKKKGVIPFSNSKASSSRKSINDLDGEEFLKAFDEKYN